MKIFYSNSKRKKMNTENKFQDARTAMKDLAKKVETIDLSGSGLVSGGKKKKTTVKKAPKKRSVTRKASASAKKATKSRSASRKRSASAKKTSGTRKSSKKRSSPSSKKMPMSLTEHKLADNLIQLGVQLKNMQLDGGKRRRKSPSHGKSSPKH